MKVHVAFLRAVMWRAFMHGATLFAEYAPTARNRQMLVTLRFNGFHVIEEAESATILQAPDEPPTPLPHIAVRNG